MRKLTKKERFNEKVLSKYNIYNSIFSTLPYENIYNTGYMLPLFSELCKSSYEKNMDPESIVESFLINTAVSILRRINSPYYLNLFNMLKDKSYFLMLLKMQPFLR